MKKIKQVMRSNPFKKGVVLIALIVGISLLTVIFPVFMSGLVIGGACGALIAWIIQLEASIWPGQE